MPFELIQKPTFLNQLLAIPTEFMPQILEKIKLLGDDPSPRGKVKKKLHGYKGKVYRLRSGDFRIVYTYGDGWVALLGVDARKDVYKGNKLVAEPTEFDTSQLPDLEEVLTPQPAYEPPVKPQQPKSPPLPIPIDEILLKRIQIPADCFSALTACQTLDDLTNADVPESVREKVFDCITTPNFDQVIEQPSLLAQSTDDILRFKEGDLLGFLLKLNPEQEKFVTWAVNAKGPTLLKGGPGTGKSTVAVYRTREMIAKLRDQGNPQPKLLFTTYTNALVTFSEQLLHQLLGKDSRRVEVKTADSLMVRLIRDHTGEPNIATDAQMRSALKAAMPVAIANLEGNALQKKAQRIILERLSPNYLLDEINDVIESRQLTTLEAYLSTSRNGRQVPLNKTQRKAIWQLKDCLYEQLIEKGVETWPQLRNRALDILSQTENPPTYDGVLIDEAQDFPPNTLRFLVQLCKAPNGLFIAADANQSIYGSSFRWSDVHTNLKFTGRTGTLRVNHRTTQEIDTAAHHYLQSGVLEDETIERQYIHTGPPPAVRAVSDKQAEAALLAQFCQTAAREFRLGIGACAILTPTEKAGKTLAGQLTYLGLDAHFMSGKELKITRRGIKILTLKSAKGLEFPIVAIAGFLESTFPYLPKGLTEAAQTELLLEDRRTLFVGMTRAMRALLLVVPERKPGPLLQNFDSALWNLGNARP